MLSLIWLAHQSTCIAFTQNSISFYIAFDLLTSLRILWCVTLPCYFPSVTKLDMPTGHDCQIIYDFLFGTGCDSELQSLKWKLLNFFFLKGYHTHPDNNHLLPSFKAFTNNAIQDLRYHLSKYCLDKSPEMGALIMMSLTPMTTLEKNTHESCLLSNYLAWYFLFFNDWYQVELLESWRFMKHCGYISMNVATRMITMLCLLWTIVFASH